METATNIRLRMEPIHNMVRAQGARIDYLKKREKEKLKIVDMAEEKWHNESNQEKKVS